MDDATEPTEPEPPADLNAEHPDAPADAAGAGTAGSEASGDLPAAAEGTPSDATDAVADSPLDEREVVAADEMVAADHDAATPAAGGGTPIERIRAGVDRVRALDRTELRAMAARTSIASRVAATLVVVSFVSGAMWFTTDRSADEREHALQSEIASLVADNHELGLRLAHERARLADALATEPADAPEEPTARVVPFDDATSTDLRALAPGRSRVELAECLEPRAASEAATQAALGTADARTQVETVARWLHDDFGLKAVDVPGVDVVPTLASVPTSTTPGRVEFRRLDFSTPRARVDGVLLSVVGTDPTSPLPAASLLDAVRALVAAVAPEPVEGADAALAQTAHIAAVADRAALMFAFSGYVAPSELAAGLQDAPPASGPAEVLRDAALTRLCGLVAASPGVTARATMDDPAETTSELLDPAGGTEVLAPRAPRSLGSGWRVESTTDLGAAHLLALLDAPGGDPEAAVGRARARAVAWAGGTLTRWRNGDRTASSLAFTADPDAPLSLCDSAMRWYRAASPGDYLTEARDGLVAEGDGRAGVVRCSGDQVRIGLADDVTIAAALTR